MVYTVDFLSLCADMDAIIAPFLHTKKDTGYGYRRTFANGQRIDMIDYAQREQAILRLGRGARLVKRYPLLYGLFDEVATVIAKIVIYDRATFAEKDIPGICKLLDSAPPGVRCRA